MKHIIFLFALLGLTVQLNAQAKKITGKSAKPIEVNMSDTSEKDYLPSLIHLDQHPIPSAEYANKKELLNKQRALKKNDANTNVFKKESRSFATKPEIVKGFQGNSANGVPNDNDIAVSNDGKVVSVVNSNIRVYDDTGKSLMVKGIVTFIKPVGNFSSVSDPRVLYDAKRDRFVFSCFSGSVSFKSVIIVGFSQTNDPMGVWNFYKLNGNSLNDSTWSDYPIMAMSNNDLFLTFNQVKDSVSWTIGFKQSVIWQIDLNSGFKGDSLQYDLWSDIKHEGKFLRNICPAKYQSDDKGENMYFLTVRNVADENDSIFVAEIDNSQASGIAKMNQRVLITPLKYGFPPNAIQKSNTIAGNYLMTNDARVLAAIYENDYIHFGLNSVNPQYLNAAVYLGTIKNISNQSPKVEAKIFSTSEREYGYPSMCYLGNAPLDHRVLYTFSHCITDSFPGTSVVYKNAIDEYSEIIPVIEGISSYDMLTDTTERWGDYTNIQRVYNKTNRAFLAGSFGKSNTMNTWVSQIAVNDSSDIPTTFVSNDNVLFPNPTTTNFSYQFNMETAAHVTFELLNLNGQRVATLLETDVKQGKNLFSFSTLPLPTSIYIFRISTKTKVLATKKLFIK